MDTSLLKVEQEISLVKETFKKTLTGGLNIVPISAPIVVLDGSGINDDLNGWERTVGFPVKALADQKAVVVNSLAKWKRLRLRQLGVKQGQGIVTDMRALRPDEDYSPIHSIYVDQWDWEKRIGREDRTLSYLKREVDKIYEALKYTEKVVEAEVEGIISILPEKITYIHAEDLLQLYPSLSAKEREHEICKIHGAVFLIGIGGELSNGERHDGRAPDYDDWSTSTGEGHSGLNGDILLWHPILKTSFEVSSMGIRVDKQALLKQLRLTNSEERKELYFHKELLGGRLPLSIGGGIGQSRVCMYMLRKQHIGEVQVSLWSEEVIDEAKEKGCLIL